MRHADEFCVSTGSNISMYPVPLLSNKSLKGNNKFYWSYVAEEQLALEMNRSLVCRVSISFTICRADLEV